MTIKNKNGRMTVAAIIITVTIVGIFQTSLVTAKKDPQADDHEFIFVGGLQRSGTTKLTQIIASLDEKHISELGDVIPEKNFINVKLWESLKKEGKFIQKVLPVAEPPTGVQCVNKANQKKYHKTESMYSRENAAQLWAQFSVAWDLEKPILIEKTPENMLMLRALRTLFPHRKAHFVIIIRHPAITASAQQKWVRYQSVEATLLNWFSCYSIFESDLAVLSSVYIVYYEHLAHWPAQTMAALIARIQSNSLRPQLYEHSLFKSKSLSPRSIFSPKPSSLYTLNWRNPPTHFDSAFSHFGYSSSNFSLPVGLDCTSSPSFCSFLVLPDLPFVKQAFSGYPSQ